MARGRDKEESEDSSDSSEESEPSQRSGSSSEEEAELGTPISWRTPPLEPEGPGRAGGDLDLTFLTNDCLMPPLRGIWLGAEGFILNGNFKLEPNWSK